MRWRYTLMIAGPLAVNVGVVALELETARVRRRNANATPVVRPLSESPALSPAPAPVLADHFTDQLASWMITVLPEPGSLRSGVPEPGLPPSLVASAQEDPQQDPPAQDPPEEDAPGAPLPEGFTQDEDDPVAEAAEAFQEGTGPVHDPTRCPYCYQRLPHEYHATPSAYPGLTADLGLTFATKNVYRGLTLVDDDVAQGDLMVGAPLTERDRIRVFAWGNMDLHDDPQDGLSLGGHDGSFTQSIVSIEYIHAFEGFWTSFGVVNRFYPNIRTRSSTTEITAGIGGEHLALEAYFDVEEIDGVYVQGTAAESFQLTDKLALEASIGLAWADEDMVGATYGVSGQDGFADLTGTVSLRYDMTDNSAVRLSVHGSTLVDDDFDGRLENAGFDTDTVWGSLGFRWSF